MRATSSYLAYLCSTISFEFNQSGESSCCLIAIIEKYLYMGMELTKIIEYFCVVRKEYIDWGGNESTSRYEFTDNLIMFYYIY